MAKDAQLILIEVDIQMWKSIFALFAFVAVVIARSNFTEPQFSRFQNECSADWRPRCVNECVQWIRDFDYERRSYFVARARRRARRLAAAWMWAWY